MHISSLWSHRTLLALALAAAAGGAQAQAFDAVRLYAVPLEAGQGLAGVAVIAGHEYLGSDERKTMVLPALSYQWGNGWFAGTGNGIGYKFPSSPDMQYGFRVTLDLGRNESASPVLKGMGDIDMRPEIGAFFNYFISQDWFLTTSFRYGAGNDRNGAQTDIGIGWSSQVAPHWRVGLGVAATYASGDYMQAFYGVTAAQSANTGYAVYSPGAGWRDVRGNAALTYSFNADWSLTGALTVRSLQGDVKRSPIVNEDTPVAGVLSLNYSF
jgi:outer membrane scaffolding protein for murein synthesis (MipA/OmpV family)